LERQKNMKLAEYSEKVNYEVRKYFDDNDIEKCFTLHDWAIEDDFNNGVSIEDSAKSFIKELLED